MNSSRVIVHPSGANTSAIRLAIAACAIIYLLCPRPIGPGTADYTTRIIVGALGILLAYAIPRLPQGRFGRIVEALADIGLVTALVGVGGGMGDPFFALYFVAFALTAYRGDPAVIHLAAVASAVGFLAAILPAGVRNVAEIVARVATLIFSAELAGRVAWALRSAREQTEQLSFTDPVTGLYSQSHFSTVMEAEISRAWRYSLPISVILLDIDNLRSINREYGASTGDTVLREVASLVRRNVRLSDVVARYAEDEIVVLLPHTEGADAYVVAQRLRTLIEGNCVTVRGKCILTTVCVGVAASPANSTSDIRLMERAREALLSAQQKGPNHAVLFTPPEQVSEVNSAFHVRS